LTLALKSYTSITLLSILLVLVVHEAGHYLAMRFYGYRNLKMFFIPLFGAAVSGYGHGSVLQESLIYLMGPLPGILIGYGCGLIFLQTRLELWRELAEPFVIINALNLMPVYPLDGGRFVFGLLPRRTYRFQWLLQGLIAAGLFVLTFVVRINPLSSVAGFALGGIWHLARANNLANRIRTSPIGQVTSDDGQIPAAVTPELIDLIRDEAQVDKPKTIAEYAFQAWTQATAKRPTALETFGLTALYVLTLLSVVAAQAIYAASIH
jgi:Zn-dependent protease